MRELLNNALQGWSNYNYNGKYMVLVFLVLLYFFVRKDRAEGPGWSAGKPQVEKTQTEKRGERVLLIYTLFMVICCAFPVTAALLMCYQTRFYDYQWIVNYVPVTIVIAFGATVFLEDRWNALGRKDKKIPMVCITAALVLLVVFCGRVGQLIVNPQTEKVVFDATTEKLQHESARAVLAALAESDGIGNESGYRKSGVENVPENVVADSADVTICLWAPKEIMASARALQPEFCLVYGRNMWDAALGAYTYETYGETECALYQWMSCAETTGAMEAVTAEGKVIDGVACIKSAVAAGVNRILLPGIMQPEAVQAIEKVLGVSAQKMEEYYLFVL